MDQLIHVKFIFIRPFCQQYLEKNEAMPVYFSLCSEKGDNFFQYELHNEKTLFAEQGQATARL